MTGRWIGFAAAALLAAAPVAHAQTPAVDSARLAGVIGERFDGYVGIAGAVSVPVRNHVSRINIQRRSLYTQLAAAKGVSPSDVGIAAACQLLSRVTPGEAYMLPDGVWRRRLPGQGAPVPTYCR